jgi:hypothetical protein
VLVILIFYEVVEMIEYLQPSTLSFPECMLLKMHPKFYLPETRVNSIMLLGAVGL